MCRARDSGALGPEWDVFLNPPSKPYAKGTERLQEPKPCMISRKLFSRHNGADEKWIHRDWWHTQHLYRFKPDRTPAVRGQSRRGDPTLTKKLFAADTCWQRERVFPTECHWVDPYTPGQTPQQERLVNKLCGGFGFLFCGIYLF